MSFQSDSKDSIFFHVVWRRSVFFSFYKLTSYPFFTISSPVPTVRSDFFIYLFYFIRPRPFIRVFSFIFSVIVFVPYACLCLHVFCQMSIVHHVRESMLTICLVFVYFSSLYSVFFLLLMGAVKIGL